MSGGSYNYLCCCLGEGALELLKQQDDVQAMYERLCGLEYAQLAAEETKSILAELEQLKQTMDQLTLRARHKINLAKVWKAVEWWDSCDYSEQEVRAAIADFEANYDKTIT